MELERFKKEKPKGGKRMKMKILAIILTTGLIFALLAGYLLTHEQISNKSIPPDKLKEDAEFLFKNLERIHPNSSPYLEVKDDALEKIDHPMNSIEFYKIIALIIDPVTVELSDAHTIVGIPEIKTEMFPLKVKIFKDETGYRVFVAEEYEKISKGSEILSINGVDATELVKGMLHGRKTPPSEAYRLAGLNRGIFPKRLFLELGYNEEFDLILKSPDGKTKEISVPAEKIDIPKLSGPSRQVESHTFEIMDGNIGLIRYNKMYNSHEFKDFLEETFSEIKEKNVENLIIDLRENHGGIFMEGYFLLDYVADKPYKMWSIMERKVSNQMMDQMRGRQGKKYLENQMELYWKPIFANAPDGLSSLEKMEEMEVGDTFILEAPFTEPKPNPLRFDGDVYVLTSSYTFSGGAILASTFKDFELGIIVGEETGDWATSYTSLHGFTLPNSKIWIGCSQWHHIRPSGEDTGRGVMPDYEVKPKPEYIITGEDRVLNFVLEELIRGNYQNDTNVKKQNDKKDKR